MLVDWEKSIQHLVKFSEAAFDAFIAENGDEEICCVFYDSEPKYGYVMIGFDTASANLAAVTKLQEFALERRQLNLSGEEGWENAKYFVTTPVLSVFNTNSAEFAYSEFAQTHFEDWVSASRSPEYPPESEFSDDYLDGNFRVAIWKAVEKLLADGIFEKLKHAETFVIGYALHDQEESILYIQRNTQNEKRTRRG